MSRLLYLLVAIFSVQNVFADSSFFYYSQDNRVLVLERLYEVVKNRYALWDLKNINVGIDGDKLFKEAIAYELTLGDPEGPVAKATSNIEFHGRVKKLIAAFKDTHFGARENSKLPMMINGIKTNPAYVDGVEVPVVTQISKKIMEYNRAIGGSASYNSIRVGHIVTAVDGVAIKDVIAELSQYAHGSSPGFISSSAIRSLTTRNFLYGKKNFSEWTLKDQKGREYKVRLPWYVEKSKRRDVEVYFRTYNFRRLDQVYYTWNDDRMTWSESKDLAYSGFSRFNAPKGLMNITEWYDGSSITLRTGYFIKAGKSYGYAQLFSYTSSSLHPQTDSSAVAGRSDAILRRFVKELKENNTPLIFDLRVNFGGNTGIAIENLSSIAKTDESYPSRTVAYRTTEYMKSLFNTFNYDPSLADQPNFYDFEMVMNEFYYADSIEREYTNVMLQTKPIKAASAIGGYDLPVVALISPWCISACDNQSFLLKHSERVTLIGQPANGTGAGFWGDSAHSATFIDPLFIVSLKIPNYLFGLPVRTDSMVLEDLDGSILAKTNSENKPTEPTIPFNYSIDTYKTNSADWIKKAIREIEGSNKSLM
jgi:C-terminal processing protease CtpA/Prc